MNWHILDPQGNSMEVTEAQLAGIARAGQLNAATLVWREGMEEWLPAGSALPHLFNGAAPPPPPPPPLPRPVGPRPAARRAAAAPQPAERKGGCLKWGLIGAGALVALFIIGRMFSGGTPTGPGYAELNEAESHLKGSTTGGYGETEAEKKAARLTAEVAQSLRAAGISDTKGSFGRGKSSLFRRAAAGMDADGFTCTCSVRGNVAVFLLHVPDLRKFDDGAKEAMGHWAWAAARLGWAQLPEPRPSRLAVGVRGIVMYDRLLEGSARPLELKDDTEITDALIKEGIDSTQTDASAAAAALREHFAKPASLTSTQAAAPASR